MLITLWFFSSTGCGRILPSETRPDINSFVLQILQDYSTEINYPYHWPKGGTWDGTTKAIRYDGVALTQGDTQKRSYCCGLVFEVYVSALLLANGGRSIDDLTADDLLEIKRRFFGDSKKVYERRRLVQFALTSMKLGIPISNWEEAKPGDFVQFWRSNGSGHTAVFIEWIGEKDRITGIRYWSTQASTDGIGYQTESIGEGAVLRNEIYIARAIKPSGAESE